jgi:translation initiation factor 2 beta subunit (eIF-2beta)/eIF-5
LKEKGTVLKLLLQTCQILQKPFLAHRHTPQNVKEFLKLVFGFELGTQVKMDEKNDRYIINGAHDAEKLANLLDIFIDKFVLCADCKNPETEFVI